MSGTSMATPGVAGVIAVLLEQQQENNGKFGTIDWLMRNGGEANGQDPRDIGSGFVSLENLEQYIHGSTGFILGDTKKHTRHIPKGFFTELLKCETCNKQMILHSISHRSNDTLRLKLSCNTHRERDGLGKIIFEYIVIENWQHVHIRDNQFIKAMRRCGICSKHGVVKTQPWKAISQNHGEVPHSVGWVSCLFCKSNGKRIVPQKIANLWPE